MKRRLSSLLLAALVLGLVLAAGVVAGCGEEEATTTTAAQGAATTTAATTPTTAAPTETTAAPTETTAFTGEPIKLKYADQNPITGWGGSQAAVPFLDKLEEATGGRVKVDRFFGETLFKGPDTWESIKASVGDFAWNFHGYTAGMTTLADVVNLPFMPFESAEQSSAVLWQLYEEFPSIQAQYADNHILLLWTSSPYQLFTINKPVKTLQDIKGMKIRTVGGPPTKVMEAMGAVPVSMPMPDTYQALQTGVLDGMLSSWESIYTFRHYELFKYLTPVPFHLVHFSLPFNKDSWNRLPADVQASIESVSGLEGSKFWGSNFYDRSADAVEDILSEKGYELTYVTPTDEEVEMWRAQFGEPIWEQWVQEQEAAGHTDARAILTRALELGEQGL